MTARQPIPERERGMALLEAMIACAIIAAMLGVTFEAVRTSASATERMRFDRRAALVAQSVLARVGADIAIAPGTVDGRADDLSWRVDIERYRGEGTGPHDDPALYDVTVSVREAGSAKSGFNLRSLRLSS